MRSFDNSTLDDFRRCMRFGYYRHVRGWTHSDPSPPLVFGSAWHAAMDVVWPALCEGRTAGVVDAAFEAFMTEWVAEGGPDPIPVTRLKWWMPRVPQTARFMLEAYVAKRTKALSRLTIVRVEEPFAIDLGNGLVYTGRRDKMVRDDKGRTIVVEHKTTALGGKSGFQDKWLRSWSPKSQIDGYLYSAGLDYPKLNASLWIDASLVSPEHQHFEFVPISRHPDHLDSWLWGVRYLTALVNQHWEAVRPADGTHPQEGKPFMAAFPQSTGQCEQYNKLCPYHEICKMRANPEDLKTPPPGMVEKFWSPLSAEEQGRMIKK